MNEFGIKDLIDDEYTKEEMAMVDTSIKKIILDLQMSSNNIVMLTQLYTDILNDENVVYILTRISQNPIFAKHFPEFYEKNFNSESVINCQQNSKYHRYGVFKHILYTVENIGKDNLKYSSHDMKILKWTMFLHDIGKPMAKTINSEGFDSFTGHDDISVEIASRIIDRFDFDDEDKNIILTLIKYHDRYLNEGDLTYDNLSFLAAELGNKRDLFQLLIEVKIADNRAKSLDVYNKFMTVVGKYYDFANEYFSNIEDNEMFANIDGDESIIVDDIEEKNVKNKRGIYQVGGSDEDITEQLISELTKEITLGRRIKFYYQPIIDLKKRTINGYEVYYKLITEQDFSYKQIMRKAREFGKYDKIQQMLFIHALERFNEMKNTQDVIQYVNIDAKSYTNYINKARIIEFNRFEILINSKIRELSKEIFIRKGNVAIDNFESSNKTLKDLEQIEPKYIKYRLLDCEDNTKQYLKELSTFCLLNSINLIVFGVDTEELYNCAVECDVRYVQGDFFSCPTDGFDMDLQKINEILDAVEEKKIV